jgi:hypothetical protein
MSVIYDHDHCFEGNVLHLMYAPFRAFDGYANMKIMCFIQNQLLHFLRKR